MNDFDYFILGNSAAAVAAIEGLRAEDPEGTIGLCSAERYRAYSRPLISYLLEGRVDANRMYIRPADFCRRRRVRTFLNRPAVGLDPARRVVTLRNGSKARYGKLLIATGGAPFVPPVKGAPRRVRTFTAWADALALEKVVGEGVRALVLGGGLIGIKAAEALRARRCEVTVVELADGVLSQSLDAKASRLASTCLSEMGVNVLCGVTIERFERREGERVAVLSNGVAAPYDLFVCAVGVRPNAEIAREAGLEVDRGVIVDDRLQTSDPNIFAAGDVTQGQDLVLGEKRPIPIWPSASRQGRAAGRNMAGGDERHEGGFAMNSVQINDVPFISAGLLETKSPRVAVLERHEPESFRHRRILVRDDRIVGFVTVGAVDRAGILTGLLRDRVDVRNFRDELLDDAFGYISLPRELRRERLSRVSTI